MSRYARKRDANHGEVQSTFERIGCSVVDLSHAGIPGWPDIVVGCAGVDRLVEIKNPESRYGRAGLNGNQQTFARDWRGGRVWVVSSVDEVIAVVGNWRREGRNHG